LFRRRGNPQRRRINGFDKEWQGRISVPADASPELFNLTVACNERTSTQPQSVSVIETFDTNFYILHITDEQIVNQYHTELSGQFHHTVGTWEEMIWMQQPVNLINPRVAIVTGDQIDFNGALDDWNNWANWGYKPPACKNTEFAQQWPADSDPEIQYENKFRQNQLAGRPGAGRVALSQC
jgi:hypothetical protein